MFIAIRRCLGSILMVAADSPGKFLIGLVTWVVVISFAINLVFENAFDGNLRADEVSFVESLQLIEPWQYGYLAVFFLYTLFISSTVFWFVFCWMNLVSSKQDNFFRKTLHAVARFVGT